MRISCGRARGRVRELIEFAEKAGAIGAAQNMVGEAVHALVKVDNVEDVVRAFRKVMANDMIVVAEIDLRGARRLR